MSDAAAAAPVSTAQPNLRHEPRIGKTHLQEMQRAKALPDPAQVYAAGIASLINRRHQLGISQNKLDEHLGTPPGLVAKWESGARRPTYENVCLWSAGLDCIVGVLPRSAPVSMANLSERAPWRQVLNEPPMTGDELREVRNALRMSQSEFARRVLKVKSDNTARKYEKSLAVPPKMARRARRALARKKPAEMHKGKNGGSKAAKTKG